ncbi:MAG TPA: hypothetical protein VHH54_06655, partial [Actinomycetota bacterium]|nr:hypothetical protein [Actinomycetota bacterium]
MNSGRGRFRAKQIERILSGEEVRDPVGVFLAALVQDLRDVSRAEVPSSVAARHLLKMRMATEMDVGDPEPLLDEEEPSLPPPIPLERRRRAVAAVGIAAAMVVMVGVAASITGPRSGGTRAGGVLRTDVPSRPSPDGPGRFDQFVTNEARSSVSTREPDQPPSGGSPAAGGGPSSEQPAGVIGGQGSGQSSGGGTGGGGGSGGAGGGSGEQPQSGGGSGSGGDVVGRGSGGDNGGQKDNPGKGRKKGGGK